MKPGVRIINCARGELIDTNALYEAMKSGKVAGAGLDVFDKEPPPADSPILTEEHLIATPHIGGSTEEAQEIVGIRIVEQMIEYLKHGVAINAVNMPALLPDQYREIEPYLTLAERLGTFAAHVSTGNPKSVRITYLGRIAETNTNLIRNAGTAGVLNRSLARKANLINAMQLAADRGWSIEERHEKRANYVDSIRVELQTDAGVTAIEGSVVLGKPRIVGIGDIPIEAPLSGYLTFLKNDDVPGVIGHVGNVLGRNGVNIANFSLGRQDHPVSDDVPLEAISVVETDQPVPDPILVDLLKNQAIKMARPVEFIG
jgi:D-3-phosphoglycerate dehydrogenase